MSRKITKRLSVVLAICLCLTILPMKSLAAGNISICGVDVGIQAGTYMQFSTSTGVASESGYYYNGYYLAASQCFGFARWCQYKLFGCNSGTSPKEFYKISVNGVSDIARGSLSVTNLKSMITAAKPGAHLRTHPPVGEDQGHSMVITNITDSGFSIAQCNGSNNNEYSSWKKNYVGTYTYTWSSYVNSNYGKRGIDYIEMPYNYSYDSSSSSWEHITSFGFDSPTEGQEISDTQFRFQGWAVCSKTIKDIICSINDGQRYVTTSLYTRNDVPGATAFLADIPTALLNVGNNKVAVCINYTDGTGEVADYRIVSRTRPTYFLGYDSPTDNQQIDSNTFLFSGWLATDKEIEEISCSINDGKKYFKSNLYTREDVPHATAFQVEIGSSWLNYGDNAVSVCVGYTDGTSETVGRKIVKKVIKDAIDSPNDKVVLYNDSDTLHLGGWSEHDNKEIDYFEFWIGNEKYNLSGYKREDLSENARAFTYQIPVTWFKEGVNILNVYVYYTDGSSRLIGTRTINSYIHNKSVELGTDFNAYIINTQADKCLTNDSSNVSIRTRTGADNQIWRFERQNNGSYKIISLLDGNVLDVNGALADEKANVQTYESNDSVAQRWYIYGESDEYVMYAGCTDKVLDVADGDVREGTNVWMYSRNDTGAQRFSIVKLDNEKPVISNVTVTDIDETGYTVKCTVTDNIGVTRVQFPTWTTPDQDDIQEDWVNSSKASGTKSGNTYTYRVNISEHNNEKTNYTTHIYAYDACGNVDNESITEYGYEDISVQYTVSYNANGGNGAPSSQKKIHGKTLTLSLTVPKRNLYNFKGWATSNNATSVVYQAGSNYTNNASTTLYAVWQHVCSNGHSYRSVVKEANCTEEGYTTNTCANCGDSYVDNEVEALGHKLGEWTTTKEASCTESGETKSSCDRCDYFETREIPKKGHSYKTVVTEPTCEEAGYTTYTCNKCGDSYTDSEEEALGHNLGKWTTSKEATCTKAGESQRNCTRCDYVETKEIPKKGHSYKTVVTAPTCEEKGYSTHTCSVCGDSYVDSEVEALGHKLGEWTTVKEASCTEAGELKRSCERCDYFETKVVEATGHAYEALETVPTCEEAGYTTHTCSVCGDSYVDDEVEALGHSFTNYISDNNATTESAGTLTATCDRCDATDTITDPAGPIIPDIPIEPETGEVVRLFGTTRYETGYRVADVLKERLGVEKFDAVVVATGKNFADALSGSYLAVVKNAPIILTNGKDDNIATLHEYIQENVTENGIIYILGGEAAVPESVEAIEGFTVRRLSGSSRYDTNLAILEEAGMAGDELIVATGKSFADSLSASAAKLPILLVKPGKSLSDDAKAIAEGVNKIYIIGGEGAVSKEIEEELSVYGEVQRVFGNSRYETSVAVAKTFFGNVEEVVIANGKNFPDGLCGGPLASAIDAPLILTADGKTGTAATYVQGETVDAGYVLGGTGAIGDSSVEEIFK